MSAFFPTITITILNGFDRSISWHSYAPSFVFQKKPFMFILYDCLLMRSISEHDVDMKVDVVFTHESCFWQYHHLHTTVYSCKLQTTSGLFEVTFGVDIMTLPLSFLQFGNGFIRSISWCSYAPRFVYQKNHACVDHMVVLLMRWHIQIQCFCKQMKVDDVC